MHLRTVGLRDWKAFEAASFHFPAPNDGRNVILIGGRNGFGKTTLFEAITLGLFGRDGLDLINRAAAASDEVGRAQSFRSFMQRALHGSAIRKGRSSCSISLGFELEGGHPVEITRRWHFSGTGQLSANNLNGDIQIFEGPQRKPIGPPHSEPDPQGWYREWIARTFLPTHLAGFFLFDGEAAALYANRDMGQQVREGIEGLLGLTWLRKLADALSEYSGLRMREVPRGLDDAALVAMDAQIASLEAEIRRAEADQKEAEDRLTACDRERSELTRELGDYGTGTRALFEDLIKQRGDANRAFTDAEKGLVDIAASDLPIALTSAGLRQRVIDRLRGEAVRESWLSATAQGRSRAGAVIEAVQERLGVVDPPLLPTQTQAVGHAVAAALDQLWNPAPPDAAADFRHAHARGPLNERIIGRLEQAASVSGATIVTLQRAMDEAAAAIRAVNEQIDRSQTTAPDLDKKKERITELNKLIDQLNMTKGAAASSLAALRPDLGNKRGERTRMLELRGKAVGPVRLARRADEVNEMLGGLIAEAWPAQAGEVAEAMTLAIRAMAHRGDFLHQVEMDTDGSVRLMTPDGRDLRELDLSAGEKQIFTQALFAAIAQVSRRVFPLVIDTPLGRLDDSHRVNVLRHLAQRDGQVILISTDTEVVDQYLDAVRPRLLKAYRIDNRTDGDIGISSPVEGYFPGQKV